MRTEVLVTSGATEALAAALLAPIAPRDEVVCFEPLYDAYVPLVERAGGIVRVGRLSCLPTRATYFLNVDLEASNVTLSEIDFARRAVTSFGVASIPLSAFYVDPAPNHLVRLCFAKRANTIDEGAARFIASVQSLESARQAAFP